MVNVSHDEDEIQLIMRPNQSLSWRGNKYLLLCVGSWLLCYALFFAYVGAWMVLPYVGLEVLALAAALYYVKRKLTRQQVMEITSQQVRITSGRLWPEVSHVFPRSALVIRVIQPKHDWGCPVIELCGKNCDAIRLGEFLNRDDCQQLVRQLKKAGLPMRQRPEIVDVSF